MVRITKDPEVRRLELIEIAMSLFMDNGYEKTSVSDIVKKVGVAQGTFYYYFQSKDDMMDAVIGYYLRDHLETTVRRIMADGSTNAAQKLQLVIDASFSMKIGDRNVAALVDTEKNAALYQKFMESYNDLLIPLIMEIVEQGNAEGVFHDAHPRETIQLLMAMFGAMFDHIKSYSDPESFARMVHAAEDIAAKALGARDGSIRLAVCDKWACDPIDR